MIIPRWWAEARHVERLPGRRQVTLRRFGWSSESQEEADAHARERIERALAELRDAGPDAMAASQRREPLAAYLVDGLPIREEIVREWEDEGVVVTRNVYGALCLNTEDALFVDIDHSDGPGGGAGCIGALVGAAAGLACARWWLGWPALAGAGLGLVAGAWIGNVLTRLRRRLDRRARDLRAFVAERLRTWCARHPRFRVAVYETPAGLRLLALHSGFDADGDDTAEFMRHVTADPLYARMCRVQRCFRARVSPKPWRAGIADHLRGGTWPVRDPEKLAGRAEWVARYDRAASAFAACRLVETVGGGGEDGRIAKIQRIHDELSRAHSGLPLA